MFSQHLHHDHEVYWGPSGLNLDLQIYCVNLQSMRPQLRAILDLYLLLLEDVG